MCISNKKLLNEIYDLVSSEAVCKQGSYYLRFIDLDPEVQAHLINISYDHDDCQMDDILFKFKENQIQEWIDEACGQYEMDQLNEAGYYRYQDRFTGEYFDIRL